MAHRFLSTAPTHDVPTLGSQPPGAKYDVGFNAKLPSSGVLPGTQNTWPKRLFSRAFPGLLKASGVPPGNEPPLLSSWGTVTTVTLFLPPWRLRASSSSRRAGPGLQLHLRAAGSSGVSFPGKGFLWYQGNGEGCEPGDRLFYRLEATSMRFPGKPSWWRVGAMS